MRLCNFYVTRTIDVLDIQFDGEKLTIFPYYCEDMMMFVVTDKFEEIYSYGFSSATKKSIIEKLKEQNVFQDMKDEFVQRRGL